MKEILMCQHFTKQEEVIVTSPACLSVSVTSHVLLCHMTKTRQPVSCLVNWKCWSTQSRLVDYVLLRKLFFLNC